MWQAPCLSQANIKHWWMSRGMRTGVQVDLGVKVGIDRKVETGDEYCIVYYFSITLCRLSERTSLLLSISFLFFFYFLFNMSHDCFSDCAVHVGRCTNGVTWCLTRGCGSKCYSWVTIKYATSSSSTEIPVCGLILCFHISFCSVQHPTSIFFWDVRPSLYNWQESLNASGKHGRLNLITDTSILG